MAEILRGDVYWADLNPVRGHEQGGFRPVLVLSHEPFNSRSGTIIALAITSQHQRAGYPLTWKLPPGLLPKDSWVKISRLRTLSTNRVGDLAAHLDDADVDHIVAGLVQLIG